MRNPGRLRELRGDSYQEFLAEYGEDIERLFASLKAAAEQSWWPLLDAITLPDFEYFCYSCSSSRPGQRARQTCNPSPSMPPLV